MKISKFKFIIGTLIIALVISIVPIGLVANADKGKHKVKENKQENKKAVVEKKIDLISKDKAIEIAKARAKEGSAKEEDLKKVEVKSVLKDKIYYIEFSTGIYKYIINVNAQTGKVSYYNEVLLVENDSNLRKALRSAFSEILDEEDIDYEDIKIVRVKSFLDEKEPYYFFELETEKYLYEIKVIKKDFFVESFKQLPLKEEKETGKDKDKKEALKPNEINQILNAIKKEVIEEYKNAKKGANKSDKKQAIADFKANKDIIKIARKTGAIDYLKDLKIELNKNTNKPINKIEYLTKDQVEKKARDKINAKGVKLDSIDFKRDNNPQLYEVIMYNDNYEYELKVHATTGAILEYLRVAK